MSSVSDEPLLTYVLIGVNVAVALGALLSGGSAATGGVGASNILSDGSVSRHASSTAYRPPSLRRWRWTTTPGCAARISSTRPVSTLDG